MLKKRIAELEKDFQPPKPCAVVICHDGESLEEAIARHIAEIGSEPDRLIILD